MPVALVSGGRGYVGGFIAAGLLDAGHEVIVGGRNPSPDGSAGCRPLTLDAPDAHAGLFDGVDIFVHAAFDHLPGKYRGGEGDDAEGFVRRNRDGSVALFHAARKSGVGHIVFLSSRAVYGTQPAGADLTESTPARPDTLYGSVKLEAETALLALATPGTTVTVLRITGVYGTPPGGGDHKWSEPIAGFLAGRSVPPRAGTEVHGDDVAAAVRLAVEKAAGGVFNVSDLIVDRHDMLAIVNDEAGTSWPLPPRADTSALNVMDTSALRGLGWRPGGRQRLDAAVRAMTHDLLAAARR
jgi:nucleoside-diphosphate-sugar epimerase